MNKVENFLNTHLFSKIFKRQEAQLVANNTLWIMIDRLIRISMGMITGIWVARYLGPVEFGKLGYANAFVMFFTPIANFSIDSLIVRELSRYPEKEKSILGTSFLLKLLGALVGFLMAVLVQYFLYPNENEILKYVFILASCFFFQAFDVIDLLFQTKLKSKYPTYIRTGSFVLFSFYKLFLINQNASVEAFIWAYFLEILVGYVGLNIIYKIKSSWILDWKFDNATFWLLLTSSGVFILQSFSIVAQTKFDQILVAKFVNGNELGQYSNAMRMVDIILFIPVAIYASFAPKVAEAKLKSEVIYQNKLNNLYRLLFYIGISIAFGMLILGKFSIELLFGSSYSLSAILFSISGFRLLAAFTMVSKNVFYINEGLFRHTLYNVLISAIINIGVSYLLLPQYGAFGAVVGNICGFLYSFFIADLLNEKARIQQKLYFKSLISFKNNSE